MSQMSVRGQIQIQIFLKSVKLVDIIKKIQFSQCSQILNKKKQINSIFKSNFRSKMIQSRAMSGSSSSNKLSNGSNYIFYQSAFNDPKTRMFNQDIKRRQYRFVSQTLGNEVAKNRASQIVSAKRQSEIAINKITGKDDIGPNSSRAQSARRRISNQSGYYSVKEILSLQSSVSCRELDNRQQIEIKKNISIQQIQKPLTSTMLQSTRIDNDNIQISRFGESSIVDDKNMNESQYNSMLDRSKADSLVQRDCNSYSNASGFLQEKNRELQKKNGQLMQALQLAEAGKKSLQKKFSELSKSHLQYAERYKKSEQSIKISRNIITTLNEKMARAVKQNEINIKNLEDHYHEELIKIESKSDEKTKNLQALVFQLKLKIIDQTNAMEQAVQKSQILYKQQYSNRVRLQKQKSQMIQEIQKLKKLNKQMSLAKSDSKITQIGVGDKQKEIISLNNLINNLKNRINLLQETNANHDNQRNNFLRISAIVKQCQDQNKILKQENLAMTKKIHQMNADNMMIVKECNQLKQRINRGIYQFAELQKRYSLLFGQKQRLEGQVVDLNKTNSLQNEGNMREVVQIEGMKRQIDDMGKYIEGLNLQIATMRCQMDNMNNFIISRNQENQKLNSYIQVKHQQIQNMKKFIDTRNIQFQIINQQNIMIKNQILIIKQQNIRINQDLIRLTQKQEQYRMQISNYGLQVTNLREGKQKILKEMEQLLNFNNKLNDQLEKMSRSKQMLVDQMEQKDGKIAQLNIWKGKTMLQMLQLKEAMRIQTLKLKQSKDKKKKSIYSQELLNKCQKQNDSRLIQNQCTQQSFCDKKKTLQELESLRTEKNKTIEMNNQLLISMKTIKNELDQLKKLNEIQLELNKQLLSQLQNCKNQNQLKEKIIMQKARELEEMRLIVDENNNIALRFQQSLKVINQSKDTLQQKTLLEKQKIQKEFSERISKYIIQIQKLNEGLVSKQIELDSLRLQIEKKEIKNRVQLQQQIDILDKNKTKQINSKKFIQQLQQSHQKQKSILQLQISLFQKKLNQMQSKKKNIQQEKTKNQVVMNDKILKQITIKESLSSQLKNQQNQINLLRSEVIQLKKQLYQRQKSRTILEQQKISFELETNKKIQSLLQQINEKKALQQSIRGQQKQINFLQTQISTQKFQLDQKSTLISYLSSQKQPSENENQKIMSLLKQINEKSILLSQLQNKVKSLESEIISLKSLLNQIEHLNKDFNQQKISIEQVKNEQKLNTKQKVEPTENTEQLLKNNEKQTFLLELELLSLKEQLKQMQNSKTRLQQQRKQFEQITNEKIFTLSEQIKASNKLIKQHKTLIQQLNNELTQQENEYRSVVEQQIMKITMIYSEENNMMKDLVSPIKSNPSFEEKVQELSEENDEEQQQQLVDIQSPEKEEQPFDYNSLSREELIEKIQQLLFFNKSFRKKVEQLNTMEQSMNNEIMGKIKIFQDNLQRNQLEKGELEEINYQLNLQIASLNQRVAGFQTQIEWMNNVYRQLQNNLNDTIEELVKTQAEYFNLKFILQHPLQNMQEQLLKEENQQLKQISLKNIQNVFDTCKEIQFQCLRLNRNEIDEQILNEGQEQQNFESVEQIEDNQNEYLEKGVNQENIDPLDGITEEQLNKMMNEVHCISETEYNQIKYSIKVSLVQSDSEKGEGQKEELQTVSIQQLKIKQKQLDKEEAIENQLQQKQQLKQSSEIEQPIDTQKKLYQNQLKKPEAKIENEQISAKFEQLNQKEVPTVAECKGKSQNQDE